MCWQNLVHLVLSEEHYRQIELSISFFRYHQFLQFHHKSRSTWQDNIQAAAIIALDKLDLENPATNLITYSNLIDPGTNEAEYFIQLLPGQYYLAAVGITVDPGLFAVKIDSFLSAETIPIFIIDNDLRNLTTPVNINYQEITNVDREIVF